MTVYVDEFNPVFAEKSVLSSLEVRVRCLIRGFGLISVIEPLICGGCDSVSILGSIVWPLEVPATA